MRGYIDPEGLVMLLFMILCLFVIVSCESSNDVDSSQLLDDTVIPSNGYKMEMPAPDSPDTQEMFVEDEPQETEDAEKKASLDDLLAELEAEPEEVIIETPSENESDIVESVETILPTTRKQACREARLPANYEACLAGCTKQCGDIALVNCEDVQLPGADGQTFACMTCSCQV